MRKILSLLVLVFLLGWAGNNVYSMVQSYSFNVDGISQESPFIVSKEQASPKDRIKESQIHVYDDYVVIDVSDPEWSTFTDTNSMDPFLDKGANAIHIVPQDEDELQVGDVVAYEPSFTDSTVIHRIIEIGEDEDGKYFIMKGDNNSQADPGKVRFDQIRRVLVAIIY